MIKPTFTVADLLTRGIKQHICVDKIDQDLKRLVQYLIADKWSDTFLRYYSSKDKVNHFKYKMSTVMEMVVELTMVMIQTTMLRGK